MRLRRAIASIGQLAWGSDDGELNAALETWANGVQGLRRDELIVAAFRAREALEAARPEWTDEQIEGALGCVLRERDAQKRRAAA